MTCNEKIHAGLTAEISKLMEENRQLKAMLYGDFHIPWEWKLSPSQTAILRCLIAQPEVSYEVVETAIYGEKGTPGDVKNTTRVHVRNLRLKLEPLGIEINNRSGFGYYIAPEVRASLKKKLRGSK